MPKPITAFGYRRCARITKYLDQAYFETRQMNRDSVFLGEKTKKNSVINRDFFCHDSRQKNPTTKTSLKDLCQWKRKVPYRRMNY